MERGVGRIVQAWPRHDQKYQVFVARLFKCVLLTARQAQYIAGPNWPPIDLSRTVFKPGDTGPSRKI